ncbi:MAG: 1-(5-phosphoribosyl)-5-[(5-phosphoribosylamino)methylideneamino]imidazole-4-carboxamide isomerase [Candidatus Omnitrophota bacterium]
MKIIPAIDLKEGKVVRLSQGKFDEMTIYSSDPVKTAKQWEKSGAKILHVVDLDGAEKGQMQNFGLIAQIAKGINIPIEVGGGIRTEEDIRRLLGNNVARVILGTKIIEDKEFLANIISKWGEKIVVSLDCSRGIVAKKGWTSLSNLKATDFAKELQNLGLSTLIYTDISRDGTLIGPNIKGIQEMLSAVSIQIIASGGISKLEDIKKLLELKSYNLEGVIVGKALYEHCFKLKDALRLCSQKE